MAELIYTDDKDPGVQMQVTDKGMSITAHDDWCGDTESGFGASVTIEMDIDEAKAMWLALGEWIMKQVQE